MTPRATALDDIQTDLTRLVFSRLLPVIATGALGLISATALVALRSKDPFIWVILGFELVACGARVGVALAYKLRTRNPAALTVRDARRWDGWYGVTTTLYASLLAALTIRVFWKHDPAGEVLCAIGCLTVCAGLATRLGLRPWILNVGGLVLLASLSISAILSGQSLVVFGGFMVALYAVAFLDSTGRNFRVVVEQLRAKNQLRQLAEQDALTALANRRHLYGRLVETCAKSDQPFAILYLDLDHFKKVNDTLGHAAGDELLRQVATRLLSLVRESDLVARLGGDEFAILIHSGVDYQEVSALAARINQSIAAPYSLFGQSAKVGVSIGGCLVNAAGFEPDSLLKQADGELYYVKLHGKGGFRLAANSFAGEMQPA